MDADVPSIRDALIARCVTAAMSTFSSFLLVVFILWSPNGLKSPYSRIIFGLSIADVLQSLGTLVGPFAAPNDPEYIFGRGSVKKCDATGFFTIAGSLAVPLYTLHLTYYFLKRVKFRVKPTDFANGEEKWLHIFIWIYSIAVSSYATGKEMINPTQRGGVCYLTPSPPGCNINNEVECLRGNGAHITGIFTILLPMIVIFVTLLTVLGAFSLHIYTSEKQLQPTTKNEKEEKKTKEKEEADDSPIDLHKDEENKEQVENENKELSALERYQQQALELVLTKSAILQSMLYILAFLLVYSGPLIGIMSGLTPSAFAVWWFSIFYPLGGFSNILIYTRPKVQALRKIIDISRIEGFIVVIIAGGETPNVMDYIYSSDHPQDAVNPELAPFRNSVLERACRVFGYSFDEGYDIEAEVERAMRGD